MFIDLHPFYHNFQLLNIFSPRSISQPFIKVFDLEIFNSQGASENSRLMRFGWMLERESDRAAIVC